jgi:hypothetical protein
MRSGAVSLGSAVRSLMGAKRYRTERRGFVFGVMSTARYLDGAKS